MGLRLLLAVFVVVGLIIADLRFNSLESTRSVLDALGAPIYWVADLPTRFGEWGVLHIQSRARALEENERLTL